MNAILKRREEIKDDRAMYQATGKQADLMMFVLIQKWNDQFKNDAKEQGFTVNEEMFAYLNETASLFQMCIRDRYKLLHAFFIYCKRTVENVC